MKRNGNILQIQGDGNCTFRALAASFNELVHFEEEKLNHTDSRKFLMKILTDLFSKESQSG